MAVKKGDTYASITLNGLDDYIKQLERFGDKAGKAAVKCVEVAQDILYEEMEKGLERHEDTGAALRALKKTEVKYSKQTGAASGEVGTFAESREDESYAGYIHSKYQEYGAPTFRADPWMRPAVDENEAKIRARWREIMENEGVLDK